jgi:putative oxidoreductase
MKGLFSSITTPTAVNVWLLILRVTIAGFLLTHGLPKLSKIMDGNMTFADPLGIGAGPSLVLAALAEVGCSLLIIIGWQTRLATIPIIFTMLVAAFIAHSTDPFGDREPSLLYLLIFITLFFVGPGKYSVDGRTGMA